MGKILNVYKKMMVIFVAVMFSLLCTGVRSYAELPDIKVLGGSYGDIRAQVYDTSKFHAHHLISREAWNRLGDAIVDTCGVTFYNAFITVDYSQDWAPSILMEKEDHEKTRSYGSKDRSAEDNALAEVHRNYEINQLLGRGAVMQLLNEECDDIRKKFGDKYDKAIVQMFVSIKGQFSHQGNILFISDLCNGCCARYRFGDVYERRGYVRQREWD